MPDRAKSGFFFKNPNLQAFMTVVINQAKKESPKSVSNVPFWQVSSRVFGTRYPRHLLGRPVNITHETATKAGKEIGGFIRVIQ